MSDHDAISRVIQLYIDGVATGDVARLETAFHPDARMFGSLAGTWHDVPIRGLFALAASAPADTGAFQARLLAVHQTGDAAVATVIEEGYRGTITFIDYFLLARIDGAWTIVCKLFAHTAGAPPEGA